MCMFQCMFQASMVVKSRHAFKSIVTIFGREGVAFLELHISSLNSSWAKLINNFIINTLNSLGMSLKLGIKEGFQESINETLVTMTIDQNEACSIV